MRDAPELPVLVPPPADDGDVLALIESWRHVGPPTPWEAIVGHEHAVRRAQEIVERLRRPPEDLARLRLETTRGLVIRGEAGVGKTLLARAIATAAGRDAIVPPTAQLSAGLVTRLYRQLTRLDRPTLVLLDEAELLIGHVPITHADPDSVLALCAAIDGIDPARGPITIATTTAHLLDRAATRPGRLSPRLELLAPSSAERRTILERAIVGLPVAGTLDLELVAGRMEGWTGADVVGAVAEAMSRSLPERLDAVTQAHLLAVVAGRFVVRDEPVRPRRLRTAALHEAGHALWAHLHLPGMVAVVALTEIGGHTELTQDAWTDPRSYREVRLEVEIALAGAAAEWIIGGREGLTAGASDDRAAATHALLSLQAMTTPYSIDTLEGRGDEGRGSERMRAGLLVAVEAEAKALFDTVVAGLLPHRAALEAFADVLLDADGTALSGDALQAALGRALGDAATFDG